MGRLAPHKAAFSLLKCPLLMRYKRRPDPSRPQSRLAYSCLQAALAAPGTDPGGEREPRAGGRPDLGADTAWGFCRPGSLALRRGSAERRCGAAGAPAPRPSRTSRAGAGGAWRARRAGGREDGLTGLSAGRVFCPLPFW